MASSSDQLISRGEDLADVKGKKRKVQKSLTWPDTTTPGTLFQDLSAGFTHVKIHPGNALGIQRHPRTRRNFIPTVGGGLQLG